MQQSLIGQKLGAYQIVEQIGMGGMATIYKAYHATMDRYVAIKVLPQQLAAEDPTFHGRFAQEVKTIANLEHRHILPVYDSGEDQGFTYLVMRYIDAGTLKDLIEQGPIEPLRAMRLAQQVAEALGHAHEQGVVHRDVKPSNVLLDSADNVYLMDFGIAKLLSGSARFTGTDMLIGTPAYMSPEQAQGHPADARSDIYSLGVMLYEMVTGQVPYEAETPMAVLLKHMQAPLPPPRRVNAGLPAALERVILKSMAKDSDERYQSGQAMVDALANAIHETESRQAEVAQARLEGETMVVRQDEGQAPPAPIPAAAVTKAAAATRPAATPPESAAPQAGRRAIPPYWYVVGGVLLLGVVALIIVLAVGGQGFVASVEEIAEEHTATAETAALAAATETATETATEAGTEATAGTTPPDANPPDASPVDVTPLAAVPTSAGGAESAAAAPAVYDAWMHYVSANGINDLLLVGDEVFAATTGGLVRWSMDLQPALLTPREGLPFLGVRTLAQAADGALWLGGQQTGIAHLRLEGNAPGEVTYYGADAGLSSTLVADLLPDGESLLAAVEWGEGIDNFNGTDWGDPPPAPMDDPALADLGPSVLALTRSSDGALWLGLEGGAARWDAESASWHVFTGESGGPVRMIYEDHAGSLFISLNGFLMRNRVETSTDDAAWEAVDGVNEQCGVAGMLQAEDGTYWFACGDNYLVLHWQPEGDRLTTFSEQDGIAGYPTGPLLQDPQGRIWVATYYGINVYDGRRWITLWTHPDAPIGPLYFLQQAEDGALWGANRDWDGLVYRLDPASGAWSEYRLPVDGITGLVVAAAAGEAPVLWATSAQVPLIQYRTGDGRARSYGEEAGFDSGLEPFALAMDAGGMLWVGVYEGLYRFDPAQEAVAAFYAADSEGEPLDAVGHLYAAPDGSLWAGHNGWNSYTRAEAAARLAGRVQNALLDDSESLRELLPEENEDALAALDDLDAALDRAGVLADRAWSDDPAERDPALDELVDAVDAVGDAADTLTAVLEEDASPAALALAADFPGRAEDLADYSRDFVAARGEPWQVLEPPSIFRYDPQADAFIRLPPGLEAVDSSIEDIQLAPDGGLWAALNYDALYLWDGDRWQRQQEAGAPTGAQFSAVAVAGEDRGYLASPDTGLYLRDDFGWFLLPITEGLGTAALHDLLLAADGTLWIATDGGLVHLTGEP